jgi:hypothetical protein
MEHLSKPCHDGLVKFLAEEKSPHYLMIPGFTFNLFVGPTGTIAKGQILESDVAA